MVPTTGFNAPGFAAVAQVGQIGFGPVQNGFEVFAFKIWIKNGDIATRVAMTTLIIGNNIPTGPPRNGFFFVVGHLQGIHTNFRCLRGFVEIKRCGPGATKTMGVQQQRRCLTRVQFRKVNRERQFSAVKRGNGDLLNARHMASSCLLVFHPQRHFRFRWAYTATATWA